MRLVIDASVAVEYLLRTPLGTRVADRVDAAVVAAPELLDAEVLAVLRKEVLDKRLSPKRAREAVSDLASWDVQRLSHHLLVDDAWTMWGNVTAYDALYLAVARRYQATVLTADGPLARAPLAGVVIENVRGPA